MCEFAAITLIEIKKHTKNMHENTKYNMCGYTTDRRNNINKQKKVNHSEELKSQVAKAPEGVFDFDATVKDDPHQGTTYVVDTFNYYRSREEQFRVPNYMSKMQQDITTSMRGILVDWMVEVQVQESFDHETLYTGVKLVDIYLSRVKGVPKTQLQLCGATALLIACKVCNSYDRV